MFAMLGPRTALQEYVNKQLPYEAESEYCDKKREDGGMNKEPRLDQTHGSSVVPEPRGKEGERCSCYLQRLSRLLSPPSGPSAQQPSSMTIRAFSHSLDWIVLLTVLRRILCKPSDGAAGRRGLCVLFTWVGLRAIKGPGWYSDWATICWRCCSF